jgi:hypothetical protein
VRNLLLVLGLFAVIGAWCAPASARGGGLLPPVPGQPPSSGPDVGAGEDLEARRERTRDIDRRDGDPSQASPPSPVPVPTPQPEPAPQPTGIVTLTHGDVRFVADLARVNLLLEVRNDGPTPLEWRHSYPIDPASEVIGATLRRDGQPAVVARTLLLADAQGIYSEIRNPPPTPPTVVPPRGNGRDPLYLERSAPDRLDISLWPVEPGETVRLELTFVTPLRGRGAHRVYVDVLGGDARDASPRAATPEGEPPPVVNVAAGAADWLIQPGDLVLSADSATGMAPAGEAGGRYRFTGIAAVDAEQPRPSVGWLTSRRPGSHATVVKGGGYGGEVAVWWFDPAAFLASQGYASDSNVWLSLEGARGSTRRVAGDVFEPQDPARPVTALLSEAGLSEMAYWVDVMDASGTAIQSLRVVLPIERPDLDVSGAGTITGWHRAQIARRVSLWAESKGAEAQQDALRYAVDLGVLVPGTGALAVPPRERNLLGLRNRRLYDNDGVPLGAQNREADLKRAPEGSLPFPTR